MGRFRIPQECPGTFRKNVQELAAADDLRLLVALREVPRVAGHDIVRGGGFGTFKEPVVRFLAANRMEMARAWVGSARFATLRMDASAASICRGCSSKRGRRKASSYSASTGI